MYLNVYLTIVFISFLASLTAYFQKNTERYLRLFPLFLLLTMLVEIPSYFLRIQNRSTTTLYNFFTSFEFLFYTYVLRRIIQNKRVKKIIFYGSWLYILLVALNFLFIQKIKIASSSSLTYSLGCLLIVLICIYYFYELFRGSNPVNLVRQPAFWICSGLLFFYCCSFPIYALVNFLHNLPPIIRQNFQWIIVLFNVFLYSSFTIAFLCRLRTRNSTF
jgi:hypothetical protein